MSYSKEDRLKALMIYKESRSIKRVNEITGIPLSTLENWRRGYNWDRELDKRDDQVSTDLTLVNKEVAQLSKELNLPVHEQELLIQVKTIEGICIATIKGEELEDGTMKPVNFDSAMRALKMCWDARDKLFKKEAGGNTPGGPQKVSYIQNIYSQGKDEANTVQDISREGILPGKPPND